MDYLNDINIFKFQVCIKFEMDDDFMSHVPQHRLYINSLIEKNIIDYYAVSMETQRSWLIVNAKSKAEVQKLLKKSMLYKYWAVDIDPLFVYDSQSYRLPALQLN